MSTGQSVLQPGLSYKKCIKVNICRGSRICPINGCFINFLCCIFTTYGCDSTIVATIGQQSFRQQSPSLQIGHAGLPESHCAGVVDGDEPLVGGGGQPDHRVRVRLLVPLRVDRLPLRRLGNRDVPAREGNDQGVSFW